MLRPISILASLRSWRRLSAAAAGTMVAIALTSPAMAQVTGQSVGQLVAAGYQVLSFSTLQNGFAALLANYREATPTLLLCNLNLDAETRQIVTSVCFQVQ